MCGIVGVIGDVGAAEAKVFETLLKLDAIRGFDSTGVVRIDGEGNTAIHKIMGVPHEWLRSEGWSSFKKPKMRLLLGHNRYATQGVVNLKNSHPFVHNKIVGVHNGTLSNRNQLLDSGKFEVDSDNIYHHISKKGLKDFVDNSSNGSYCLAWVDGHTKTFNMLRNHQRPMYMARGFGKSCTFFASEEWMLEVAFNKNSYIGDAPTELEANKLYQIKLDGVGLDNGDSHGQEFKYTYDHTKPLAVTFNTTTVVGKLRSFFYAGEVKSQRGDFLFTNGSCNGATVRVVFKGEQSLKRKLLSSSATTEFTGSVLHMMRVNGVSVPVIDGESIEAKPKVSVTKMVSGFLMTELEFNRATSGGCAWCTGYCDFNKHSHLVLFDQDRKDFLCHICNTKENRKFFIANEEWV